MNFDSIIDCWLYFAASFLIVRIVHVMCRPIPNLAHMSANYVRRILLILRYMVQEAEPVSVVATAHGRPYNSESHGFCFHETMAFEYTLAKGICDGECR